MIAVYRDSLKLFITALVSAVFGWALVFLIPVINAHGILFLAVLPFGILFLMFMVISPQKTLVFILLTRALLDPVMSLSRSGDGGMGVGAVFNLIIILLTAIVCIQNLNRLQSNSFIIAWIIFLAISLVSVFYSPMGFRGFRLFLNFVTYMFMALLPILMIKEPKEKFYWLKIMLASSVIPLMVGYVQLVLAHGHSGGERIFGTFTHPNIFAFFLSLMLVIDFYLLNSPEARLTPFWKSALRFYIFFILIMIVFTQTRNAWIVCWLIFLIYSLKVERKYLFVVILLPLIALLIPSFQERVIDLLSNNDTSSTVGLNSFAWRRRLWSDSMVWVAQKPLFGYGLTSFANFSPEFSQVTFGAHMGAHNVYVETLFEMGVVGLLAFIGVLLSALNFFRTRIFFVKKGKPYDRLNVLAFAYVLGYMTMCLGDNMSYYLVFNWYSWFFIGLMIACNTVGER